MSKAARTTTTGVKINPPPLPRHEDGRVSGARRALNYGGYDGLMQLGSDAFSAPLPPPASRPPLRFAPRLHAGWYMLSAAIGFSVGAIALAIAFKPGLGPQHPPVKVETAAYTGSWTMVAGDHATSMREVLEPVAPPAADVAQPVVAAPIEAAVQAQEAEAAPHAASGTSVEPAPAPQAATPASTTGDAVAHGSSGQHARARAATPVAQLSRAQVIGAMHQVEPAVYNCFATAHGTAVADITIVGRTGRITTAQVSGQNGLVGSCIARVVRHAIFPPFKSESLTIRYPFAH